MQHAAFDILAGTPYKNARLVQTVVGYDNARKRMKEIAAQKPGRYFIFNEWSECVLDEIETHDFEIQKKGVERHHRELAKAG